MGLSEPKYTREEVEVILREVLDGGMEFNVITRLAKCVQFLFDALNERDGLEDYQCIGPTLSEKGWLPDAYFQQPFERQVLRILRKLEATMSTQGVNLTRLQGDVTKLAAQVQTLKQNDADLAQALRDANARLIAIIAQLKAGITGDDDAVVGAAADALEAVMPDLAGIAADLSGESAAEGQTGVTLVLSPTSANVAPGGQVSFSTNIHATYKATNGTIDATGVYTAPESGSATDTVTATSDDGQTATASITIG